LNLPVAAPPYSVSGVTNPESRRISLDRGRQYISINDEEDMIEHATLTAKRLSRAEAHEKDLDEAELRKLPPAERIARVRDGHRKMVCEGNSDRIREGGIELR
jgi:hypothetical protein